MCVSCDAVEIVIIIKQDLLEKNLIPSDEPVSDSQVFYLKMKGDYYRYLAEVTKEDKEKGEFEESSLY